MKVLERPSLKSLNTFGVKASAGLLLTTFAISLGAPFWFDLLGKVSNIKGTGKKPLTTLQETALTSK